MDVSSVARYSRLVRRQTDSGLHHLGPPVDRPNFFSIAFDQRLSYAGTADVPALSGNAAADQKLFDRVGPQGP